MKIIHMGHAVPAQSIMMPTSLLIRANKCHQQLHIRANKCNLL